MACSCFLLLLFIQPLQNHLGRLHTGSPRLGQAAGDTRAVGPTGPRPCGSPDDLIRTAEMNSAGGNASHCVGSGRAYFSRSRITWAAFTPEAPAWARPRVMPAPSPTAKKPGREVSSSPDRASRAE